jgi:predicted nucleic acid-binding protein
MLDASDIHRVDARFTGCRDRNDNMFFDVLDQTEARWICTDDPDLHDVGREEVIGMGELVRLLQKE